jgi:hypothetical protein
MIDDISSHENKVRTQQFPGCERMELRQDVVFVFPSELTVDAAAIADGLQSAMSYLKDVTLIDPTQELGSRVVIGYSVTCTQPNWSGRGGNRVCLPQAKYLNMENEPFDVCSHELVHPFYNRSRLHQSNERWGDCFCEFLRGPVKEIMGLDGKKWWREKLADTRSDKQNYGNVAGQFLMRAKAMYSKPMEGENDFLDRFIGDIEIIKQFVSYLFAEFSGKSFSSEFVPTTKVR